MKFEISELLSIAIIIMPYLLVALAYRLIRRGFSYIDKKSIKFATFINL